MAPINDIKHRLLREAVQENVGTRQPVAPRPLPPRHRTRGSRWWKTFLVVLPILLVSVFYVIPTDAVDRPEFVYLAALVSKTLGIELFSRPPPRVDRSEATFLAPAPSDLTVFPLGIKKVVLDPGHGGKDGGAATALGLLEKDVTLDIAHRLRRLLEKASFEVLMTREKDETMPLAQRAAFANAQEADLFVSIHANWFGMPTVHGVETYYLGPTDDPQALQLAALENRNSGYSLGEFRRLLEGVYLDLQRAESRQLAQAIQPELAKSLRQVNPTVVNRGVKMTPFLVLVTTKMPAILTEVSYLSNQDEARLMATQAYRQRIAQGFFQGIRAYAKTLKRSTKKGS